MAEQLGITGDLESLRGIRVAIELSPKVASDPVAVQAFLTVVNLATRLGPYLPTLHVRCPSVGAVSSVPVLEGDALLDQAVQVAREATDTSGLCRGIADETTYELVLSVGPPTLNAQAYLPISWTGWKANVGPIGTPPMTAPHGEVLAALVASAMAVARLMGFMAQAAQPALEVENTEWRLNVLRLDDSDYAIDPRKRRCLPRLLLLGAGAIAINFAYAGHLVGNLVQDGLVMDEDHITKSNANRHVTCLYKEAEAGTQAKARHLAKYLPLTPVEAKYDAWKDAGHGTAGDFPLVITTVDNTEARRSVMSDLPRVTLDAATGGHSLTLMRAADAADACGLCAYPLPARPADPAGRGCGTANIAPDLPGASVSYVSALAGFLLAGQLIAEACADPALQPGKNIWNWHDLLEAPPGATGFTRRQSYSCASRHQIMSHIQRSKWSGTP